MANNCCIHINKIKTSGQLRGAGHHNHRIGNVLNADKDRTCNNEILYQNEKYKHNLTGAFQDRINHLDYYKSHAVRSNAVMAIEVCMELSPEAAEDIDIEKWKETNMQFLRDKFDVAPDGRSNLLSVAYHADEATPHIHAIVMPIDERGRLNASAFLDGAFAMHQFQREYNDVMEDLGIEASDEYFGNHVHVPTNIKSKTKWEKDLSDKLEMAEIKPGEDALEYRNRIMLELQNMIADTKRECDEQRKALIKETNSMMMLVKEEARKEEEHIENLAQEEMEKMEILNQLDHEIGSQTYGISIIKGIEQLEKSDPTKANEIKNMISELQDMGREEVQIEIE